MWNRSKYMAFRKDLVFRCCVITRKILIDILVLSIMAMLPRGTIADYRSSYIISGLTRLNCTLGGYTQPYNKCCPFLNVCDLWWQISITSKPPVSVICLKRSQYLHDETWHSCWLQGRVSFSSLYTDKGLSNRFLVLANWVLVNESNEFRWVCFNGNGWSVSNLVNAPFVCVGVKGKYPNNGTA